MGIPSRQIKKVRQHRLSACYAAPLRSIRPDEAAIYPSSIRYLGGIYDRFNHPHKVSRLKRYWGRLAPIQAYEKNFVPNRADAQAIAGHAIYGGLLFNHFGHFLLETLARAWHIENYPGDVYFFKTDSSQPNDIDGLYMWQQELLGGLAGDIKRVKIIYSDTVFEKLLVPKPGFVIRKYCRRDHAEALRSVGRRILERNNNALASHEKIWLSRSSLSYGLVYGEADFENALSNEGFVIFHPEQHSIAEQIQVVENSAVIAGFTGSAWHLLLLAKNNGARVLHFSRIKEINENYPICIDVTGFAADYYHFFEKYDNGGATTVNPTLANVYQNFPGIWQVLYRQGLVSTAVYPSAAYNPLRHW